MRCWPGLLLGLQLFAGADPPVLTRGTVLEWEGSAQGGEVSVRVADHHVYVFHFDAGTAFEQDDRIVPFNRMTAGDSVEIASEQAPGTGRCHALSIRILASAAGRPSPFSRNGLRWYRSATERLFPRGNLTFAGLVVDVQPDRLRLRTRERGEQVILLRADTRFLHAGSPVGPSALRVNTRVFIRAGKTLENELEAFQVVWGEILTPR